MSSRVLERGCCHCFVVLFLPVIRPFSGGDASCHFLLVQCHFVCCLRLRSLMLLCLLLFLPYSFLALETHPRFS